MKNYVLVFLLFLSTFFLHAQIIPLANRVDWTNPGYPGDFPEPANIVSVMDFGAVADGVTDDRPAVLAAIASLNGEAGVVFFPAGTYRIASTVSIPSGAVLRGESATQTFIKFDMNGAAIDGFSIAGNVGSTQVPVLSGYQKGSFQLMLDAVYEGVFAAGDYVELRQSNGSWDTNPATWATYSVGQVVKITEVSGTTLTLERALRIDYDVALNPHLRKITPKSEVGIECMNIERIDEPDNGAGYNILFSNAVNCWVKGIESAKSVGSHVMIENSANIEVRTSYFHHAFTYDGSGTRGYGVTLNNHSGDCLIENNIFRYLRHAMMTKHGANGNVFAYNYSLEPYRVEMPTSAAADISLHGHFSYANLFEGNIVQNIMIDHYWGPSGPYNTFFRNRAELYGIVMTNDNGYASNMQNFVGNECPNTGLFLGNYVITGSNHIQHGNNIRGTVTPSGTQQVDDVSYYLSGQPGFWQNAGTWPTLGYPNAGNSGTIPAKERYNAGGDVTICFDEIITHAENHFSSRGNFSVFPNPFTNEFSLNFESAENENILLSLHDVSGKTVFEKNIAVAKGENQIYLSGLNDLSKGIYILKIQAKTFSKTEKVIAY